MKAIKCQAKHDTSQRYWGCSLCGGFSVLLEQRTCDACESTYWDRITVGMTVYEGKSRQAFDGTKITYHLGVYGTTVTCSHCPTKAVKNAAPVLKGVSLRPKKRKR